MAPEEGGAVLLGTDACAVPVITFNLTFVVVVVWPFPAWGSMAFTHLCVRGVISSKLLDALCAKGDAHRSSSECWRDTRKCSMTLRLFEAKTEQEWMQPSWAWHERQPESNRVPKKLNGNSTKEKQITNWQQFVGIQTSIFLFPRIKYQSHFKKCSGVVSCLPMENGFLVPCAATNTYKYNKSQTGIYVVVVVYFFRPKCASNFIAMAHTNDQVKIGKYRLLEKVPERIHVWYWIDTLMHWTEWYYRLPLNM